MTTTILFVSLAVMECFGNVVTATGSIQRCVYSREVIVRAEDIRSLSERKYLLGPLTKTPSTGCFVTLSTGETVMVGKACRKVLGK